MQQGFSVFLPCHSVLASSEGETGLVWQADQKAFTVGEVRGSGCGQRNWANKAKERHQRQGITWVSGEVIMGPGFRNSGLCQKAEAISFWAFRVTFHLFELELVFLNSCQQGKSTDCPRCVPALDLHPILLGACLMAHFSSWILYWHIFF